jgi:hypothetical protein
MKMSHPRTAGQQWWGKPLGAIAANKSNLSKRNKMDDYNPLPHKITVQTEREFADYLKDCTLHYWRERHYDIEAWIDLPERSVYAKGKNRKHHLPVYPVRSNIGTNGFPPKRSDA